MAKNIFSSEVAAGLQDIENKYAACNGIFDRARKINTEARAEEEPQRNASAVAVTEYSARRQGQVADQN